MKMLNDELEREENNMFFLCPQGHVRLDFDDASDYEFYVQYVETN
jgi:transcription initiation factor TFIIE subunit alpha